MKVNYLLSGVEKFLHQAIDLADKIYLTIVHTDVNADVFFPEN